MDNSKESYTISIKNIEPMKVEELVFTKLMTEHTLIMGDLVDIIFVKVNVFNVDVETNIDEFDIYGCAGTFFGIAKKKLAPDVFANDDNDEGKIIVVKRIEEDGIFLGKAYNNIFESECLKCASVVKENIDLRAQMLLDELIANFSDN